MSLLGCYHISLTLLALAQHSFAKIIAGFVVVFKRLGENWAGNSSSFTRLVILSICCEWHLKSILLVFLWVLELNLQFLHTTESCWVIMLERQGLQNPWDINSRDPPKMENSRNIAFSKEGQEGKQSFYFYLFLFPPFSPKIKTTSGRKYWTKLEIGSRA